METPDQDPKRVMLPWGGITLSRDINGRMEAPYEIGRFPALSHGKGGAVEGVVDVWEM